MTGQQDPLSHVKVLDPSRIRAAPWASQILADPGAEVIEVDRPGAGDGTQEAGCYLAMHRGKRSITLHLDSPEGRPGGGPHPCGVDALRSAGAI